MEQNNPNQPRLQAVDRELLTALVRKSLDHETLVVTDWNYHSVHGGFGGGQYGTFIYRFKGRAQDQNDICEWSLILKIIHARLDQEPASTHYWKREAEAYRSGLLEDLPGEMRAAKSFDVVEYPDEACWIWQEDVQDAIGNMWSLEHYKQVARHFGQFNGAYLTAVRPIPDDLWLSTGWLRKIVKGAENVAPQIQAMLKHASLHPVLPSDADEQFLKLWNDRQLFWNTLDKLPQTFAHQDPVRRNFFPLPQCEWGI